MLHRRLLEHPLYKRPGFIRLWTWCLLKAQYKDGTAFYRGESVKLGPGEFVFGRRLAARETGLSDKQIRNLVDLLIKEKMIIPRASRNVGRGAGRFSIYHVENWAEYQILGPAEMSAQGPTRGQQKGPAERPAESRRESTKKGQQKGQQKGPHLNKEDIREEYKAATDVPAIYSALSRTFLEQQRKQIPKESVWKDFEARVAEGAKSLHLFHTQNGWTEEEIRDLLDWIPNDKDFWSTGIRTLGSIRVRKKGKGTPMKFENAAADMRRKRGGLSPSGVMTYDQMIAVKDEELITTDHFQRIGDDQWKRK